MSKQGDHVIELHASMHTICALLLGGRVFCWGRVVAGGVIQNEATQLVVPGLSAITSLAGGVPPQVGALLVRVSHVVHAYTCM